MIISSRSSRNELIDGNGPETSCCLARGGARESARANEICGVAKGRPSPGAVGRLSLHARSLRVFAPSGLPELELGGQRYALNTNNKRVVILPAG